MNAFDTTILVLTGAVFGVTALLYGIEAATKILAWRMRRRTKS
jgi:hypothetical protein